MPVALEIALGHAIEGRRNDAASPAAQYLPRRKALWEAGWELLGRDPREPAGMQRQWRFGEGCQTQGCDV